MLNAAVQLVTEECSACGILYAFPETLRQQALAYHNQKFYCPNGHSQSYTGPTDAEKERARADRLERRLANKDEDLRATRASLTATKGQLTKTKKRVANGVCPCCNRSFANLGRHMAGQHPQYAEVPA